MNFVKRRPRRNLQQHLQESIGCYGLMPRFNNNNNNIINIATWHGFGYAHETVNHQENFVDPVTGANTRRIECPTGATLKPSWSGECVERRKLCCPPSHLAEYWWKQMHRVNDILA